MEALVDRFHAILNDKEQFKKESSVIYKDIKTWLTNNHISLYNYGMNDSFKQNYSYPGNTPTEIIIKLIENNYEFTQDEFIKLIECITFGKTKSYISKCYTATVNRKNMVVTHIFDKFNPTNEQINKLLKCYNEMPIEGKSIKYFDWIRVLVNKNYPFDNIMLNKIMSVGCPLPYLLNGNYTLEANTIKEYFINGIDENIMNDYKIFEKQNVFNDDCLNNLLTSQFMKRHTSIEFVNMTEKFTSLINIMLSKGAAVTTSIIENYINSTIIIQSPFTNIFNHLLNNINKSTITENDIIKWMNIMRTKDIPFMAYYKINIINLIHITKMYTCDILNNIMKYPDMHGNNTLPLSNISELLETMRHFNYVIIDVNNKNNMETIRNMNKEITNYDFFRLFLHHGVEPNINTMEAIIPLWSKLSKLTVFGTTNVNYEYMDELINKYKIYPNKKCLDCAVMNVLNINMIKELLNYKIIPDEHTINSFIFGINIYRQYFVQKILEAGYPYLKEVTELLIRYGLIINIEIVRNLFPYYQVQNLERFNIPYDDNIYYLCHKYNIWPREYITKFTIDQNIMKLREMFAKHNNHDNILKFMKKYNLKPDRYCIENLCVYSIHDALFFIQVLKCKPTAIGLALLSLSFSGSQYHGTPFNYCSKRYFDYRRDHLRRIRFCPECENYNFDALASVLCPCQKKKNKFGATGEVGPTGNYGYMGATGLSGKIYISTKEGREENVRCYENNEAYTYHESTRLIFILFNIVINERGEDVDMVKLFEISEEPEIMSQTYDHLNLTNF